MKIFNRAERYTLFALYGSTPPNMENDCEDLIARVKLLDKIVKENSEYTKLKIKEYYDKHSTEVKY